MVIYEIFMSSFCDNFKDLKDKIPYLKELGVDALWITPFYPSPSDHCYDTTDYKNINPRFGTMDDFVSFVDEMHKNNLKVIIDMVFTHTSYNHPWFQDSINERNNKKDYYIWSEDTREPENKFPTVLGPNSWRICIPNKKYYLAPTSHEMPALNSNNPLVREEIKDIVKFWVDKGIDGIRLDSCPYVDIVGNKPLEFWKWFSDMCKEIKSDIFIVGEAWVDNQPDYTKALGHSFNFDVCGKIKYKVYNPDKHIEFNYVNGDVFFLDNHDMTRVATGLDHNQIKGAYNILFTMPGDIVLYYGDEIGMTGSTTPTTSDDPVRRPMEWDKVHEQRLVWNSVFSHVKFLIREYKK